ncbi:MAG: phosphoglycerate mutase family protein [Propionibacteriaceae bacterium]|nr:phosphoglycerate mutase family protein [Propionibacteriaceae bacterium]
MQLLLIRHGQTSANRILAQTGVPAAGSPDPELTDIGLRQADLLAQAFADGRLPRPNVLISSLLLRAVQTVAPISAVLDMPVLGSLDAYEVGGLHDEGPDDAAAYRGVPASQLRTICPRLQLPAAADESGWYRDPADTRERVWQRAQQLIAGLRSRYGDTDQIIAVVTHGWFAQYVIRAFIGWQPDADGTTRAWFELSNTGTALLRDPSFGVPYPDHGPDGGLSIYWINRTDHLPDDLLTH